MSFWDEWFKRFWRGRGFFPDIERLMEEMEKDMAKMFKDMEKELPDETSKVTRLPDGSVRRQYGPFVYGYSVRVGPDGKPVIREFGNMKPSIEEGRPPLDLQEKREPLVDIIEQNGELRIVSELPGVDKEDIQLYVTENTLTLNVEKPGRNYFKELELPFQVDPNSAKSNYRNGVLETNLRKLIIAGKGKRIDIE
jgi:HSP20 family protein